MTETATMTAPVTVVYVDPPTPPLRVPVPCACCGQPCAYITVERGTLALEICSRHHGDKHTNILTLGDIGHILRAAERA